MIATFVALVLTSCQKGIEDVVISNGQTGTGSSTPTDTSKYLYYYEATIDGVSYKEIVTETNGYEAGSGAAGLDTVIVGGGIALIDTTKKGTSLGVDKGMVNGYLTMTNDQFKAFFTPGNYPYKPEGRGGVRVGWIDKNDDFWATDQGVGDQTGSSFKITAVKTAPSLIDYYVEVTAEFNCKLYDVSGKVKTLTNGKVVCLFGKF